MMRLPLLRELLDVVERGDPCVVITLVEEAGHVPQDPGSKAIVTRAGLCHGTVGGGKIEARAVQEAQAMLADKQASPRLMRWDLQRDLGMTCGGVATLLFEPCGHEAWPVMVFGAGHIAQALIPILATFSCQTTCIDQRPEWLNRLRRFPGIRLVETDDYTAQVRMAPPGTAYIICTQGHATDLPVLEAALRRQDASYIGVIGSVTKGRSLRAALMRAGLDPATCERFQIPMGMPVGSNAPAEIAVSIAAKLLEVRDRDRAPRKSKA